MPYKIVVTAKLSDYKLYTKLAGIIENATFAKVILVRKTPLLGYNKIVNINPRFRCCKILPLYELWRCLTLVRICRQQKIDAILGIQLILHGLQARIVGWLSNTPVILSVIGNDFNTHLIAPWSRFLLRPFVIGANSITVMGNDSKRVIKNLGVSEERIFVVQNYHIDTRFKYKRQVFRWDILFIGDLVPRKRVDNLIKVLAELDENLTLAIVGDGPERKKLQTLVRKLDLMKRISFVGNVQNVEDFFNQSKILVLPSHKEGVPAVAVEAMYTGTPSVLPNVNDIPTFFESGKGCELFIPNKDGELARCIKTILLDNIVYQRYCQDCLEWSNQYKRQWSKQQLAKKWQTILESSLY